MMNWDQTDALNKISQDRTKSAKAKKSEILALMRNWGETVNYRGAYATNHALTADRPEPDIDPGTESTKARLSIPGQTGRTVYPGLYN